MKTSSFALRVMRRVSCEREQFFHFFQQNVKSNSEGAFIAFNENNNETSTEELFTFTIWKQLTSLAQTTYVGWGECLERLIQSNFWIFRLGTESREIPFALSRHVWPPRVSLLHRLSVTSAPSYTINKQKQPSNCVAFIKRHCGRALRFRSFRSGCLFLPVLFH